MRDVPRFTVQHRWFWGMLRIWPRWCRESCPDSPFSSECRFRYGHPYPHENFAGRSWSWAAGSTAEDTE